MLKPHEVRDAFDLYSSIQGQSMEDTAPLVELAREIDSRLVGNPMAWVKLLSVMIANEESEGIRENDIRRFEIAAAFFEIQDYTVNMNCCLN